MKILSNTITEISTGEAVTTLRGKVKAEEESLIKALNATTVEKAAITIWTIIKIIFFDAIAFFCFYIEFRHLIILALVLILGDIYIVKPMARKHAQLTKPAKKDGEVYIGKSFRHHIEMYSSVGQTVMGIEAGRSSTRPVEVGADGDHYINYMAEPNPHVLILGSTSSGKTTTMRTFISRACMDNEVKILLIDWNGESEDWAKKTNATFWKVPEQLKVNPFRLNGFTKEARASVATENLIIAGHLTPLQATKLKSTLLGFYLNNKEPTLFDVWYSLCSREKNELVGHRLRAIQRVIGTEPEDFWQRILTGNNVISLAGLNQSEKSLVAYAILQRLTELFEKNPDMGAKVKMMVVLDEAWQFLTGEKREFALETHEESIVEKIIRLGRKYGFGIVVSTQQVEDLPNVFINSSALVMLHYYRNVGYFNKRKFDLNPFELAYIRSAAQGEMLLYDRGADHNGQWWADYVKVAPLTEEEMAQLAKKNPCYVPKKIEEPELPIEEHQFTKPVAQKVTRKVFTASFPIPMGAPSPSEHAAMLGLFYNKGKPLADIIEYIKKRGWITSNTTIYGYNGSKPGVFEILMKEGLAARTENAYELTERGLDWVEPNRILANQQDKIGSEQHRRLLARTIEKLHESNTLVLTTNDKHSFDLLGYPVHSAKKWIWDQKAVKGYEIQTSARVDSIDMNKGKAKRWNIPLVWVAGAEEVIAEIKKATRNENEYWLVD